MITFPASRRDFKLAGGVAYASLVGHRVEFVQAAMLDARTLGPAGDIAADYTLRIATESS